MIIIGAIKMYNKSTTKKKTNKLSKYHKTKVPIYKNIFLADTQIKKCGNSYGFMIPTQIMKKNDLQQGQTVRPILLVPTPKLKTKDFKEVPLPFLEIKKCGNSAFIRIRKSLIDMYKLDELHPISIYLHARQVFYKDEVPQDEVIIMGNGKIKHVDKSTYLDMVRVYDQYSQEFRP